MDEPQGKKKKKNFGCQMLPLKQVRTPGTVGLILIRAGFSKEGNETEKKKIQIENMPANRHIPGS